ncbi:MAG: hypothetical protein ABI222_13595, partial [Opitutaceae bacterium]
MIAFDAAHRAVHYPEDRRFRIWLRPSLWLAGGGVLLALIAAAWIQFALAGLPRLPPVALHYLNSLPSPPGFPLWLRLSHFLNFFFVMLLIRSGLSILMDHPRLYFND